MFSNKQTKRSHETPMDFEWSGQAPTDPNSPFMKMTPQQQQQQSGFGFGKSFGGASSTPAPAFRNPAFTTPRKPFNEDQFSEMSGVDSSPADNADEDTPDFQQRTRTMPASINGIGSVRQQPIFGRYGAGFAGNSPGRADRRGGKIGTAIAQKMRKRKRIDRDQDMMVKMHLQDSDSESEDSENRPRNKDNKTTKSRSKTPSPGFFASTMTYIDTHPNLPNILSYYAQLGVNMFIAFLTIFGIWSFWMTVRADVDKASEKEQALLLAEMARCAHDYVQNKCGADQRLPALGRLCESWEHCMNQDPNSIGRARVSAHTFAQIFNSFVEPISYKAMGFVVLIVIACILINNFAFSLFRAKTQHPMTQQNPYFPPPQNQQPFHWGAPPQTPQHKSLGYDAYSDQTYQQIMPSQTPGQGQRSPSKGQRSPSKGNRSPSKEMPYYLRD